MKTRCQLFKDVLIQLDSAAGEAAEAVKETLSDSRIVVMAGQGHLAMDTGTDLFTTEVLRFVEGP